MVINTNIAAFNAGRLLGQSFQAQRKSLARLSSGARIVSPEDDAAGLSQSAKLHNESLRDNAALQILQNGISFLQTKDGFLQKVQKALDRMSELSVLALDATKTDSDRSNYNTEFQTLIAFITDVGNKTFNGKSLFFSQYSLVNSGAITWTAAKAAAEGAGGHLATITSQGEQSYMIEQLQAGGAVIPPDGAWIGLTDEVTEGDYRWVTGEAFSYTNWAAGQPNALAGQDYVGLGVGAGVPDSKWNDAPNTFLVTSYVLEIETGTALVINGDGDTIELPTDGIPYVTGTLSTASAAKTALISVKSAIEDLARSRGNVGATLQRVQSESDSLSIQTENLDAAVSRINDTDVAVESTNLARQSILTQSGTAMLAQANLLPQSVLRLLG